ncbi:TPA: hypothetical protein ACH3X2_007058 [Trebouxia sp. C0005]
MLAWQGLNRRSALSSGNGSAVCDAQADSPVLTGSRSRPWKRWVRPCGPQKPMRECLGVPHILGSNVAAILNCLKAF